MCTRTDVVHIQVRTSTTVTRTKMTTATTKINVGSTGYTDPEVTPETPPAPGTTSGTAQGAAP